MQSIHIPRLGPNRDSPLNHDTTPTASTSNPLADDTPQASYDTAWDKASYLKRKRERTPTPPPLRSQTDKHNAAGRLGRQRMWLRKRIERERKPLLKLSPMRLPHSRLMYLCRWLFQLFLLFCLDLKRSYYLV